MRIDKRLINVGFKRFLYNFHLYVKVSNLISPFFLNSFIQIFINFGATYPSYLHYLVSITKI